MPCSMHASGTHSWKNQRGAEGGPSFEGGVIDPRQGVRSTPSPPANLPAASG
jgi:hypothetical protein